jgi:hypothetical protein
MQEDIPAMTSRLGLPPAKPVLPSLPTPLEWLSFALQSLFVGMVQAGNDIFRGNISRPDPAEAQRHAHDIVAFESAHGFFFEPNIQHFFEETHDLLGVAITWPAIQTVADAIYGFAHLFVTLAVAMWVYVHYRHRFPLLRNIMLLTTVAALVGYELYPLAPPRLTTGLVWDGHLFHFQDTMGHILGTGKLNGTPIGYNPFSAMPSLHVAWAIIIGATILLLGENLLFRLAGVLYPMVVVLVIVMTANHYFMDAVGAVGAVAAAAVVAASIEPVRRRLRSPSPRLMSLECKGRAGD